MGDVEPGGKNPDADVLAGLAAQGIDLTQPLLIEFAVAASSEEAALAFAKTMADAGFVADVHYDDGQDLEGEEQDAEMEPAWTVYVPTELIPQLELIKKMEAKLEELATRHGCHVEGWGAWN